ncbi:hypothetical protein Pelo_4539 [Pelomyxa schiedti]|nr:hypothetical protein Pelo_4539 [Pelomyxa schiedti]
MTDAPSDRRSPHNPQPQSAPSPTIAALPPPFHPAPRPPPAFVAPTPPPLPQSQTEASSSAPNSPATSPASSSHNSASAPRSSSGGVVSLPPPSPPSSRAPRPPTGVVSSSASDSRKPDGVVPLATSTTTSTTETSNTTNNNSNTGSTIRNSGGSDDRKTQSVSPLSVPTYVVPASVLECMLDDSSGSPSKSPLPPLSAAIVSMSGKSMDFLDTRLGDQRTLTQEKPRSQEENQKPSDPLLIWAEALMQERQRGLYDLADSGGTDRSEPEPPKATPSGACTTAEESSVILNINDNNTHTTHHEPLERHSVETQSDHTNNIILPDSENAPLPSNKTTEETSLPLPLPPPPPLPPLESDSACAARLEPSPNSCKDGVEESSANVLIPSEKEIPDTGPLGPTSDRVLESITITSTKTVTQVTLYVIEIKWKTKESTFVIYTLEKRYRDFADLHSKLSTSFNTLPSLPGKKMFGSQDECFVQQRKLALEKYLNAIATTPTLVSSKPFQEFIQENSSTITNSGKPHLTFTQSRRSIIPPSEVGEQKLQTQVIELQEKNKLLCEENLDIQQQIAMLQEDLETARTLSEDLEDRLLYSEEIRRLKEEELSSATSKYNQIASLAKTTAEKKDNLISATHTKLEASQTQVSSLLKTLNAAREEAVLRERRMLSLQKQRNQVQQQLQKVQDSSQAQSIPGSSVTMPNIEIPAAPKTLRGKTWQNGGLKESPIQQIQRERNALAELLAAKDAELAVLTKGKAVPICSSSPAAPTEDSMEDMDAQLIKQKAYITRLEGRISELENTVSCLNGELCEMKAGYDSSTGLLHEKLDTAHKEIVIVKNELSACNKRRLVAEETVKQLSDVKSNLWEKHTALKEKLKKAQTEVEEKNSEIDLLRVVIEGEKRKQQASAPAKSSKTLTKSEVTAQALCQAKAYQDQLTHLAFEMDRLKYTLALAEAEKNFEKQQHQADLASVKLDYIKVAMAMKEAGLPPKYSELDKYEQVASKLYMMDDLLGDLKDLQEKYFFALAMNIKIAEGSSTTIDVNHLWTLACTQKVPHKSWHSWILSMLNPTTTSAPTPTTTSSTTTTPAPSTASTSSPQQQQQANTLRHTTTPPGTYATMRPSRYRTMTNLPPSTSHSHSSSSLHYETFLCVVCHATPF